jgi:hypothetical protein
MAYTIEQEPNQLNGANNPMVYVLKDTSNTGDPKYRYIAQVYISTGDSSVWVEKAKIKIHKNQASVGIVDIHKIVRTYLETQTHISVESPAGTFTEQTGLNSEIHYLGKHNTALLFSSNTSQLIGVKLSGGFEKATSATTAPTETLAEASYTSFSTIATTPFTNTASNVGGLDINDGNNPMGNYVPTTVTKKFLTNAPTVQFVRGSSTSADNIDYLTMGFIQDSSSGYITDGVAIANINVSYYQADGTLINSVDMSNEIANGGIATADDVRNSLLYVGVGPANLENWNEGSNNHRPSSNANWVYYTIKGKSSGGAIVTQSYYFYRYGASTTGVDDRHQSCTRYNNIRLAWVNRLGCWDYMNFRGKSVESVDVKRTERGRLAGSWGGATFNYENTEGQREVVFTEAKRKLIINSDWLNEDEGVWLEELFTSKLIHMIDDNRIVYPVIVMNKSYTKKTSVNNKIKIQYKINLEYANPIKTNS